MFRRLVAWGERRGVVGFGERQLKDNEASGVLWGDWMGRSLFGDRSQDKSLFVVGGGVDGAIVVE